MTTLFTPDTTTPIESSASYEAWVAYEAALKAQHPTLFADPHPPEGESEEVAAAREAYDLQLRIMYQKSWDTFLEYHADKGAAPL